jgi:arabinose-5-phosphate isomerase
MRTGDELPRVPASATLADAVIEMGGKGMGMTVVLHDDDRVAGIFTDGDLRRAVERGVDFSATRVDAVMAVKPRSIAPDALAAECVERMEALPRVMQLIVVDSGGRLAGALHMHDLFRARVL